MKPIVILPTDLSKIIPVYKAASQKLDKHTIKSYNRLSRPNKFKMKIAQIAPLYERIPPKRYGGTERFVNYLTEELVKRGHEVTLFATGDSITEAKLESVNPHPLREVHILDTNPYTVLATAKAYKKACEFDIIHNNTYPEYVAFPAAYSSPTPTVTTLHAPFNLENKRLFQEYKELNFVPISNNQRKSLPGLNYTRTIYHGIPVSEFPFKKTHGNYLLYVGRIALIKGTHFAIDVAEALNKELIIAAKLDPQDIDYFNRYIGSRLSNGLIKWVGEVGDEERNKLYANALCLPHPVTWREPFGLTLIESMACGTPVIAFRRGSIPEIIVHRKTGFVVESEKEMAKAVRKIETIDRSECRKHVKTNFNLKKMVDAYEKLYNKIV